jgi:uncharacterized membrane protein
LAYDWRSRSFIALSVMGIAVAFYHAYGEITFTVINGACNLSKQISCGTVFSSGYTSFLGVSFWVYGVVWFPVCLVVGIWAIRKYGNPRGSVLVPFLMVGNIFTLYPWDIEIRLLGGVYCVICVSLYCFNYIMTFVAFMSKSDET